MPKVITEVELPDGTFLALHGHTAQQAAAVIAEELGGKVASNGSPHFKGAAKPRAEKPSLRPAGLVHASQLEQSLTVQNSEAWEQFVSNEEPLGLPSMFDDKKPVVRPAGMAHGPNQNQTDNNEDEDDAEAKAEYHRTLRLISNEGLDESQEPLELPQMKFDEPAFMRRQYKDDEQPEQEEALGLPPPVLGN